jgi:hypothetical protein
MYLLSPANSPSLHSELIANIYTTNKGYNLARIANPHLRKLMQDVFSQRPVYATPSTKLSLRKVPGIPNLRDPGTDWCHKGLWRKD